MGWRGSVRQLAAAEVRFPEVANVDGDNNDVRGFGGVWFRCCWFHKKVPTKKSGQVTCVFVVVTAFAPSPCLRSRSRCPNP